MENATQENIGKLVESWNDFKVNYSKVNSVIEDLGNCRNDYTRTILFNTALKILNNIGLGQGLGFMEILRSVQGQVNDTKTQK